MWLNEEMFVPLLKNIPISAYLWQKNGSSLI